MNRAVVSDYQQALYLPAEAIEGTGTLACQSDINVGGKGGLVVYGVVASG